ncbi:2-oxo-4-hydroxy-4-carboxy-5-ureidoimidazoline decarboxylase [Flexivirga endophytica]|uniref:2-oxo-4-hydroxy-4-carboxy-5-ureidoimidazoline decarboxylase n=1 Tax=Flexivirga endophytica TaxID=1849103 RepID=UPI00166C8F46|nr:2-oxo-4-hydroxy-4-carboxy-5-ureidoimidazoline decarboxylase [Flexivirga endophytica]
MRNQNSTLRNALEVFDTAPVEDAVRTLLPLCGSQEWARTLADRRPYGALAALLAASDAVFPALPESEVAAALSGHPRIGERMRGEDTAAQLSRSEQSAMQSADEQVTAQIVQGNQDYEARFDRVFLIRAAGRAPAEILAELRRRLDNDDAAEEREVREQLRQITRLRLEGAFSS